MVTRVKFPILAKLMLFTCGTILVATAIYLALAVRLFQQDKQELVYELTASSVKTLSAEIEATLSKYRERVRLLTQGHRNETWVRAILESDPGLISFSLYSPSREGGVWREVASIRNSHYLRLYGRTSAQVSAEVRQIRDRFPIPFAEVIAQGGLAWNSTLETGAPILSLAFPIAIRGSGRSAVPHVASVDVRLDQLLDLVSRRGISTLYVVDRKGEVVAHPDRNLVKNHALLGDIPLVQDALESELTLQLKKFEWNGSEWLGAFAPVAIGSLRVISQVEESVAFMASRRLVEKSILFAALVITASTLFSGLLAQSFTRPLHKLVAATEKLSKWEFGESVHVKSNDEIATLSRAFNAMALDLQRQHQELQQSHEELERKVKARTAKISEEKEQSEKTHESLIRTTKLASLGELAGAAAHEILNPLNNINIRVQRFKSQGMAASGEDLKLLGEIVGGWKKTYEQGGWEALKSELEKEVDGGKTLLQEDLENLDAISKAEIERFSQANESFDFISGEMNRVTRIVNNMRSLSRVGGERRPLDIHEAIDETISALSGYLEQKQIEIVREFSSELRDRFVVVADKDELVQVFSNLIRNAVQAILSASRRNGRIRVSTERTAERVEVRIIDNGSGISDANRGKIFESNFTTKTAQEGTGLGLSISRRLIRAFNGDLELESARLSEGCTFLVWFPSPENTSRS